MTGAVKLSAMPPRVVCTDTPLTPAKEGTTRGGDQDVSHHMSAEELLRLLPARHSTASRRRRTKMGSPRAVPHCLLSKPNFTGIHCATWPSGRTV